MFPVGIEVEFISPIKIQQVAMLLKQSGAGGELIWSENIIKRGEVEPLFFLEDINKNVWSVTTDYSLVHDKEHYGYELISPVLRDEKDLEVLGEFLFALRRNDCTINFTCGLHIHIDFTESVDYLQSRLLKCSQKQNSIMLELEVPENRYSRYCKPYPEVFVEGLKTRKFLSIDELVEFYSNTLGEGMSDVMFPRHPSRYYFINLNSYYSHKTIEFRVFNGTLDLETIKQYIDYIRCLWFSE